VTDLPEVPGCPEPTATTSTDVARELAQIFYAEPAEEQHSPARKVLTFVLNTWDEHTDSPATAPAAAFLLLQLVRGIADERRGRGLERAAQQFDYAGDALAKAWGTARVIENPEALAQPGLAQAIGASGVPDVEVLRPVAAVHLYTARRYLRQAQRIQAEEQRAVQS
jgi:hypothetical protein